MQVWKIFFYNLNLFIRASNDTNIVRTQKICLVDPILQVVVVGRFDTSNREFGIRI